MSAGLRVGAAVVAVALVVAYAALSGRWVSTDSGWYASLPRPAWQPPDWVFGVAWSYNFLALIVVGIVVALRASPVAVGLFLGFLVASVACALAWAYLFYVPHSLAAAALALTAAALLTVPLVVSAWSVQPWWGVALLPYLAWLCVATSLAWAYSVQATV